MGGGKKVMKAVVLCRVTAGVVNEVEDGWDQQRGFGAVWSADPTPRNPNGILPCNVIVYS